MFSKTAEYALRATFYIAREGSKESKLSIKKVAKAIGSPNPFTAKILQYLSKNDVVISSVRGPNGGFYIREEAKNLPVMTILEVINEDDTLKGCILGLPHCSSDRPCPMHANYQKIKNQLIDLFMNTTIGDIAESLENEMLFLNPILQKNAKNETHSM